MRICTWTRGLLAWQRDIWFTGNQADLDLTDLTLFDKKKWCDPQDSQKWWVVSVRKNDLRNNTCIQTCPVGYFGLDGEIKEGGRPRIGGTCERCLGIGRPLDVGNRDFLGPETEGFLGTAEGDSSCVTKNIRNQLMLACWCWFTNCECFWLRIYLSGSCKICSSATTCQVCTDGMYLNPLTDRHGSPK